MIPRSRTADRLTSATTQRSRTCCSPPTLRWFRTVDFCPCGAVAGRNNWLSACYSLEGTQLRPAENVLSKRRGAVPGFADLGSGDVRPLRPGAEQLVNLGWPDVTYVDGDGREQAALPTHHYVHPMKSEKRADDKKPDIGAYELQRPEPKDEPAKPRRAAPSARPASRADDDRAAEGLYRSARQAERARMKAAARQLYEKLIKDFPDSKYAEMARERLK